MCSFSPVGVPAVWLSWHVNPNVLAVMAAGAGGQPVGQQAREYHCAPGEVRVMQNVWDVGRDGTNQIWLDPFESYLWAGYLQQNGKHQ